MKSLILNLLFILPLAAAAQTPTDSTAAAGNNCTSTQLNEATVTAARIVFVTKRDTVVYNMIPIRSM